MKMKFLLPLFALSIVTLHAQTATPTPAPTPAPTIVLSWDPPLATDNVASANVYQKSGTTYAVLTSVAQPTNQFTLPASVGPGGILAVSFVNTAGIEGPRSADMAIPAIPSAPANLKLGISFSLNFKLPPTP